MQPASRPDVDAIFGIPPTVAIEQRTSRGGRKSTVATLTEIYHFLRLLFVKLGTQYCPDCDVPIEPQSSTRSRRASCASYRGQRVGLLAPLVVNRKGYYTDLAKWARGQGLHPSARRRRVPADRKWPRLTASGSTRSSCRWPTCTSRPRPKRRCARRLRVRSISARAWCTCSRRWTALVQGAAPRVREACSRRKRACPSCGASFPELDPRLFSFNSKHGWCPACYGTGLKLAGIDWDDERAKTGTEDHVLDSWLEWLEVDETCPACAGRRLNPRRSRCATATARSPTSPRCRSNGSRTSARAQARGPRGRDRARHRRRAALAPGDSCRRWASRYLALDRAAPTLSGGEAQRIRLAAQLGSNLRGVCYILDEPTIGLHPRDNRILLDTLEKLEAKGNTAGGGRARRGHHPPRRARDRPRPRRRQARRPRDRRGLGRGTDAPPAVGDRPLSGAAAAASAAPAAAVDAKAHGAAIEVSGARLHNLKNITCALPLGRLTVVTGVSGSGKSTLARDVLYANLRRIVAGATKEARRHRWPVAGAARRWESVGRVLEVDQTPIGKTPRSCPATYVGFWDAIRRLFAETPRSAHARLHGRAASRSTPRAGAATPAKARASRASR